MTAYRKNNTLDYVRLTIWELTDKYVLQGGLIFLMGTLFLLSFPRSWSLYPQAAFLLTGFIIWTLNFRKLLSLFLHKWYVTIPPIAYFAVHVINSIITSSPMKLLEDRLMFIVIPCLGFPFFEMYLTRKNFRLLLLSFISGIVVINLFFIVRVIYIAAASGEDGIIGYITANLSSLLSFGFSVYDHPTYLSLKILWIFLLIYFIPEEIPVTGKTKITLLLFLTVCIFLLSSKAGMFGWLILNAGFFFYLMRKRPAFRILKFVGISGFVLFALFLILRNDRFEQYVDSVKNNIGEGKTDLRNLDQRTREWYTAYHLIREKPLFGFGIDSIDDVMVDRYYRYKFILEAEMRVNAHNQLLEAQVTFGILGSAALIWMLMAPLIYRKKISMAALASAFIILISCFLFIESMFNRQWGIMFFLYFYLILSLYNPDKQRFV